MVSFSDFDDDLQLFDFKISILDIVFDSLSWMRVVFISLMNEVENSRNVCSHWVDCFRVCSRRVVAEPGPIIMSEADAKDKLFIFDFDFDVHGKG